MDRNVGLHPLLSMTPQIDEQGLMVFDVHSMPSYNEPFSTPYMVLALNLKGWVKAECDMRPVCFRRHDIAILPPRHILCAHETSADYHGLLIVLSRAFQEGRKQDSTDVYRDNFHYLSKPHISLNDDQFALVHQLFRLIKMLSRLTSPSREEQLTHLLNTFFLFLQDCRRANGFDEHQPSSQEQLFSCFYEAITKHFRQSREVRFYAELMHLSPKHFATIIKQHTGINALQWINGYVVIQAKILLRYNLQLTVQQISVYLGFSDQAAFSRFFKLQCGVSPSDYRDRK